MDVRHSLGIAGEDVAAGLYKDQGFRIVDRNYRVPMGEIDLVATRGYVVVFCEVKTRSATRWGTPAEAVSWRKQQCLRRAAAEWLRRHKPGPVDVRFDVVSVVVQGGHAHAIQLADAF